MEKFDTNVVQVFKHRDIIKMLNRFLKKIETANDDEVNVMLLFAFLKAFNGYDKENFMPYKVMNEAEFIFDDEKAIKQTNMPRLKSPRRNISTARDLGGLRVIAGGRASITY